MHNEPQRTKRRRPYHHYDWKALIEEWSQSGKTPLIFCREKKIAISGFYTWRNRLFPEGINSKVSTPAFLPVQVEKPSYEPPSKGLVITYPNGCKVEFHDIAGLKLLGLLNQAMGV